MGEPGHKPVAGPSQSQIGTWLQGWRKRTGLSQQDVAVYLSVDKQTISDWETGRYRMTAEDFLTLSHLYTADLAEVMAMRHSRIVSTRSGRHRDLPDRVQPGPIIPAAASEKVQATRDAAKTTTGKRRARK